MCMSHSNIAADAYDEWDVVSADLVPDWASKLSSKVAVMQHADDRQHLLDYFDKHIRIKDDPDSRAWFEMYGSLHDYWALQILQHVSRRIAHESSLSPDAIRYPIETLASGLGNCTERCMLASKLMEVAGIPLDRVMVVFGRYEVHSHHHNHGEDHVWIAYRSSHDQWVILDPPVRHLVNGVRSITSMDAGCCSTVNYSPLGGFHAGSLHLPLTAPTNISPTFRPQFIGEEHESIERLALNGLWKGESDMEMLMFDYFDHLRIDVADKGSYIPEAHFDSGSFVGGWQNIKSKLASFKRTVATKGLASIGDRDYADFHRAAHAIADFYAHSSYAHFMLISLGANGNLQLPVFDPNNPPDFSSYVYTAQESSRFTVNQNYSPTNNPAGFHATWDGKLISGRYGQPGDTNLLDKVFTQTLSDPTLRARPNWKNEIVLPQHAEIAVDANSQPGSNVLYIPGVVPAGSESDKRYFSNQFHWRKDVAVRHVRQEFQNCIAPAGAIASNG
jgi:hypothetical protein